MLMWKTALSYWKLLPACDSVVYSLLENGTLCRGHCNTGDGRLWSSLHCDLGWTIWQDASTSLGIFPDLDLTTVFLED